MKENRKKARRVIMNNREGLLKNDFNKEKDFEEDALVYCLLKMKKIDAELFEILHFCKIRDNTITNTAPRFSCSESLMDSKVASAYDLLDSIFEETGFYDL